MKIVQLIIGPDTQRWQGALIGLGDDGKVYVESPRYDCNGDLIDGAQWKECEIKPAGGGKDE